MNRILLCAVLATALVAPALAEPAAPGTIRDVPLPKVSATATWEPAKTTPAPYTEKISGTMVTFDMVPIPAGEIRMPDPAKKGAFKIVKVGPFWMSKHEVRWDEFDVFTYGWDEPGPQKILTRDAMSQPSKPYGEADRGYGRKGYPVINETFLGAKTYCSWLSKKTGKKYRLPTDAEWEYACRAVSAEPAGEQLKECAVFSAEKTSPVGSKTPNRFGLYDMLGNVAEWCVDMKGKPVVCGGCFMDKPEKVKPTARKYQTEAWQENDPQDPKSKWWLSDGQFVGFRVIRVESAKPAAAPAPKPVTKPKPAPVKSK